MPEELFSLDSEIAVLAGIIQYPDTTFDLEGLRWYMFSSESNRAIFRIIEDNKEKSLLTDGQLLITSLEAKKELSKVGGKKTIENLIKYSIKPENVKEFVKIVINSYKAKSLITAVNEINTNTLTIGNIDEKLYELKHSLNSISGISGESNTIHVGDAVKETYNEIIARTNNPGIKGTSWGIKSIDGATGGKSPGEVTVIGGRPGSGKSALICNSILADAKQGIPVLLIEKEMAVQDLMERFIAIDAGIPITNLRQGLLNQQSVELVYKTLGQIKEYPIYIDTNYRNTDLYTLEATIRRYKLMHDVQIVYLDYIQLLSERGNDQTHELGRISKMFRIVSNELGICSIILSQLNRMVEYREDKRPQMSDLRQSGNLEEDADFVIGLYRDEYYNKETKFKNMMEFIILKARNGPVGTVTTKFIPETNQITDLR